MRLSRRTEAILTPALRTCWRVSNLLHLDDGVDALGRDQKAGVEGEDERGVEAVVDGDVDLAAAVAGGVHDEGTGGAVALGQVTVEEPQPAELAGGSAGAGMLQRAADLQMRQHAALDVKEDLAEVDAAGVWGTRHQWGHSHFQVNDTVRSPRGPPRGSSCKKTREKVAGGGTGV